MALVTYFENVIENSLSCLQISDANRAVRSFLLALLPPGPPVLSLSLFSLFAISALPRFCCRARSRRRPGHLPDSSRSLEWAMGEGGTVTNRESLPVDLHIRFTYAVYHFVSSRLGFVLPLPPLQHPVEGLP